MGSRGKTPAEFRKYGQNTQGRNLDEDLNWTDARKAAVTLLKAVPPLTADLNTNQKLGYEHLITDLLFHVPKFGHELLAGRDGQYGGLNLKDRSYFKTGYGSMMAISSHASKVSTGDLLRCLQLAKTDFNKWCWEMKDIIPANERRFPHYLTTGRLQKALESNEKFSYVSEHFFTDFRFTQMIQDDSDGIESAEDEDDEGDESPEKHRGGSSTSVSVAASERKMMELLTKINSSQQNLSRRIQKVESKVGVAISPLKPESIAQPQQTRDATNLQPRKIDLLSPVQVKIETCAGETAFEDITSFRLFDETYRTYMQQMEGITKNPSASKKRKASDANWNLQHLAMKFGIDPSTSSAPVLKEHVAHMATVTHLFKHYSSELKTGNFKDPALVPMKKRKWGDE